jgi:hypothetical protein
VGTGFPRKIMLKQTNSESAIAIEFQAMAL